SLAGWDMRSGWAVKDGVITGSDGATELNCLFSHLAAEGVRDARISFDARVHRKTAASVFLGCRQGFAGYELKLDTFSPSAERAGSLAGFAPVRGQLAPPELWFHVDRAPEPGGMYFSGPVGGEIELRNIKHEPIPRR